MYKCSKNCSTVKKQIRDAIAEAPWLLDEVSLQRKVADPKLHVTRDILRRDEPERVIEPAAELEGIQEPKIVQETLIVQEPIVISEKLIKRDDEEVDFVEERELVAKRITVEEDTIDEDEIDQIIPPTKQRDESERVIKPVDVQEPRAIQETLVVEQPIVIPTDYVDDQIEVAETRKPVVDETIIERTNQIPVTNEKAEAIETEIIDQTITPAKFALEQKVDVADVDVVEVETRLPQDAPTRQRREKEEDDDYGEFIDEELQKSLPTATAKQIAEEEEEEVEEVKTVRREKIPIRDVEVDRKEFTGPSVPERFDRVEVEDRIETPVALTMEDVSREPDRVSAPAPAIAEDVCDDTCPLINQQKERIMRKLEERQRIVDHYYLTKGFSYFEDVCTCSLACVLYTLSRDQFVRSIFASLALFAVGLKLCSELDAWEMPSRVS
ncbi:probable serine/threonine-protein kinase kinX [Odontomachus brunneus]|uniref:probable serine/threonine-protein kinase kinX n=1 Tax=Odontomachus brunneus TaxID=486640 RepID=UPI0013F28A7A|nr:probable serine/threonine-protein kinase kinX [Odontomachus brunneus]